MICGLPFLLLWSALPLAIANFRLWHIADVTSRLYDVIETVAGYARESGKIEPPRIDAALKAVDEAINKGTYLAVAPQFLVTATI